MVISVEFLDQRPIAKREIEFVERKGLGHPDYIADSIAEAVSRELCKEYIERFRTILHHNVDKVLVVGGQAKPVFGGGEVTHPIYILVSGRATGTVKRSGQEEAIPLGAIAVRAAKNWLRKNFRFLDPETHVIVDYRIGRGSVDLVSIFEEGIGKIPNANDTSLGVAFAPLTPTEKLVYSVERFLNSKKFKKKLPEVGEDVKVMALRRGNKVHLTIAAAIISSLTPDADHYLAVKEEIKNYVLDYASKLVDYEVTVDVNTADRPDNPKTYYLVVTGTSAEHGDDGMTGRGNRVNGLITPMRPMSIEATAGKNPVSHVGKIYNVLAQLIANSIAEKTRDIEEVYVKILSQIGKPINDPLMLHISIIPAKGASNVEELKKEAIAIAQEHLDNITKITELILQDKVTLY